MLKRKHHAKDADNLVMQTQAVSDILAVRNWARLSTQQRIKKKGQGLVWSHTFSLRR
jgi:hypothetical protein